MFDEAAMREKVRLVRDYPKEGIMFRDITTLLKDGNSFDECMGELCKRLEGLEFDYVIGIEARGFITGAAIASRLGKGFIPVRKKGKLPYDTIYRDYDLEYGSATLEMHRDAVERGSSVVITDDLLATGGTAKAAAELVESAGGKVGAFAFIIELPELNGRERLSGYRVTSLMKF